MFLRHFLSSRTFSLHFNFLLRWPDINERELYNRQSLLIYYIIQLVFRDKLKDYVTGNLN